MGLVRDSLGRLDRHEFAFEDEGERLIYGLLGQPVQVSRSMLGSGGGELLMLADIVEAVSESPRVTRHIASSSHSDQPALNL